VQTMHIGGISYSVAVKFDLYNNAGEGNNPTRLHTDGASPTIPATTLGDGVNLHSGDVTLVQMSYDGTTLTMTITDTTTAASFTTSWPINIPGTVGGNTAYVGFTGGTGGGGTTTQQSLTWTYSTDSSGTTALTAATPVITPGTGTYTSPQTVTITGTTAGATIYYTLDGSAPTTSSTAYSGTFQVSTTTTVKAIATAPNFNTSATGISLITIQSGGSTVINFGSGLTAAGLQLNGSAALNGTALQLTNIPAQAGSAFWTTPVNVQSSTNNFSFQLADAVPTVLPSQFGMWGRRRWVHWEEAWVADGAGDDVRKWSESAQRGCDAGADELRRHDAEHDYRGYDDGSEFHDLVADQYTGNGGEQHGLCGFHQGHR
jgi:hypothetical protein